MRTGTFGRALSSAVAVSATVAFGAIGGLAATVVSNPEVALAASSVNGPIVRSETLSRSQFWVDKRVTYTQTGTWAKDPQGKAYRRDCSGLVSMAWHLSSSLVTAQFKTWSNKFVLPSLHDLKPGDALLKTGHIELFVKWKTPGRHEDGAWVYSFNQTGETVRNPYAKSNKGKWGFNPWSEMDDYSPIRYKKIKDATSSQPTGNVLREPDGAISLVVGGAPFHLTPAEYAELGSPAWVSVPEGTFEKMPSIIADGTYVRTSDTKIHVIVGSAKYHLSEAEYQALGTPSFTKVPTRLVQGLDGSPADNTFLRDITDRAIYQVIGGAKYHLSPAEYDLMGSPRATNVPRGFINKVTGTVPSDDVFLRDPATGAIYQIAGGAKYHVDTEDFALLGGPEWMNAPIGFINRIDNTPDDGSFLRDVTTGAIYQIVGGAKYHLSPSEYAELDSAPATNVPPGFLDRITATVPSSGFMRDTSTHAIYQVVNGAKYHLSAAEYEALGTPSSVNVPDGFIARLGTIPGDGSFIRDISTRAIYEVVGGHKYHLSAAEYAAMGSPPSTNVPAGFAAVVTGTRPAGSLFLRDHASRAIYQVVNGAKYHLSAAEYEALDTPSFVNVPAGLLALLGSVPSDGTYLRTGPDGPIYIIENGAKRHVTAEQWEQLPEEQQVYTNVPVGFLNAIPDA